MGWVSGSKDSRCLCRGVLESVVKLLLQQLACCWRVERLLAQRTHVCLSGRERAAAASSEDVALVERCSLLFPL